MKHATSVIGIISTIVVVGATALFCTVKFNPTLPKTYNLNSRVMSNRSNPFRINIDVNNVLDVSPEDIASLAYQSSVRNMVISYIKRYVPVDNPNSIAISAAPMEETRDYSKPREIEFKAEGCNSSTSNLIVQNSYTLLYALVSAADNLLPINNLSSNLFNNPFSLQKAGGDTSFNPSPDADFGFITNDFSFKKTISNHLQTVDSRITEKDYAFHLTRFETLSEEDSTYRLFIAVAALPSSPYITGEWNIFLDLKITSITAVVKPISDVTIPTQGISVLVEDVKNVQQDEIDNITQSIELKATILQAVRIVSPLVLYSDFSITCAAPTGDYSDSGFTKNTTVVVTSKNNSNYISGSFSFTLAVTVREPSIEFAYSAQYYMGYNLNRSNTFKVQGHADVKVVLTTVDIKFLWNVPRNYVVPNAVIPIMELLRLNYISSFTANWGAGSVIDTDVDSTAEFAGMHDEINNLADTRTFVPVTPIKNGKNYIFGHKRNGGIIPSTQTYQASTPAEAPPGDMPDIWVSNTAAPVNNTVQWDAFWNAINIKIDNNSTVSTDISFDQAFRFYVSSLDNYKEFKFSAINNETKFNGRTA